MNPLRWTTCGSNFGFVSLTKPSSNESLSACPDGEKRTLTGKEQIIGISKQHEAGVKTADLCREHGISAATFYGWKAKFGGMDVEEGATAEDDGRREPSFLKLLVAGELSLHGEALKAVIRKNGWSLPV